MHCAHGLLQMSEPPRSVFVNVLNVPDLPSLWDFVCPGGRFVQPW